MLLIIGRVRTRTQAFQIEILWLHFSTDWIAFTAIQKQNKQKQKKRQKNSLFPRPFRGISQVFCCLFVFPAFFFQMVLNEIVILWSFKPMCKPCLFFQKGKISSLFGDWVSPQLTSVDLDVGSSDHLYELLSSRKNRKACDHSFWEVDLPSRKRNGFTEPSVVAKLFSEQANLFKKKKSDHNKNLHLWKILTQMQMGGISPVQEVN